MKKAISLVLVLIMVLGCASLVACGGGGGGGETPPSVDGLSWDDIPIYAGAEQIQKGSWAIPPVQGDWSKIEWRYYRINGEVNDVAMEVEMKRMVTMFYKMEMPKNGWQEIERTETQDMSWGYYSKNNGQDGAIVWVSSNERNAVFALMRAAR